MSGVTQAEEQAADLQYGFPIGFTQAVAETESGNQAGAYNSSSGATGRFQFLPSTMANPGYGVAPITNPDDPMQFGSYFSALLNKEGGDYGAALNDYSGGGYGANTPIMQFVDANGLESGGGAPGPTSGIGGAGVPAGSDPFATGSGATTGGGGASFPLGTGAQGTHGWGGLFNPPGVSDQPKPPATNGLASPAAVATGWEGTILQWFIRGAIVVIGVVAIGVALSQFKATQPIVEAVKSAGRKVRGAAMVAAT